MYIYIEDGRAKKDSSSLGTYDGAEGAGINSPGNVTRQQKFSPKLCKVFEFLFVFSLIFFFYFFFSCFAFRAQSLFNCLFQLLLSSHFKVFRYCCKYFVKNGIQSVSKMLLTKQTVGRRAISKGEGIHSCPGQGKSIVNWAQVSGVYGWASEKFFLYFLLLQIPAKYRQCSKCQS